MSTKKPCGSYVITIPADRINHSLCRRAKKTPEEILIDQLKPILTSAIIAQEGEKTATAQEVTITRG